VAEKHSEEPTLHGSKVLRLAVGDDRRFAEDSELEHLASLPEVAL